MPFPDKASKPDIKRVEEMFDWQQADGKCVCDVCGYKYFDHPTVPGYRWLRKLCDGDLVKL